MKPCTTRFSAELKKEIKLTAKAVKLTEADTMRQAMELGLPVLRERLGKK